MRLNNLRGEGLAMCLARIINFVSFARGAGHALLAARANGFEVVLDAEHDSVVMPIEGANVQEVGVVALELEHAMTVFGAAGSEMALSTTGNRLHLRRRSGPMWVSGGSFPLKELGDVEIVERVSTPAAPAAPPEAVPEVPEDSHKEKSAIAGPTEERSGGEVPAVASGDEESADVGLAAQPSAATTGEAVLELVVDGVLLKQALSLLRVPRANNTLPVLDLIRVAASTAGLKLSMTDLEVGIIVSVPLASSSGAGAAVWFLDRESVQVLIKGIRKGDRLTFRSTGAGLEIDGPLGRMSIQNGYKDADWPCIPPVPDGPWASVDDLGAALKVVEIATTRDETRWALPGLLIEGSSVVGTDGHRLHRHAITGDLPKMLLPVGKGIDALMGLGTVSCSKDVKHAFFRSGNVTVIMKLLDGTFPAYKKVIPEPGSRWHELPLDKGTRELWARKLKALTVNRNPKTVDLTLNGQVVMKGEKLETGSSSEATLDVALRKGGEVSLSVHRDYLVDALSFEVEGLFVKDSETQCLLRGPRVDVVIMPLRTK